MTKRFYIFLLSYLCIILLVGLACELSEPSSEIPVNDVESGSILFQDDFSVNNNQWDVWDGKEGSRVAIEDQTIHIVVQEPQYDYWSLYSGSFNNVRIDVTAAKLGGPDDNDFGVVCRYQDKDNYYALLISSDGYAGILKVHGGDYSLLGSGQMQYNEAVRQGDAVNLLRAECIGETFVLYANGAKLIEASDINARTDGRIGVIAGTNNIPGTSVYFDNFIVYQP